MHQRLGCVAGLARLRRGRRGYRRWCGQLGTLTGAQGVVLRLDDGDLYLQLALLRLQRRAHILGLLGGHPRCLGGVPGPLLSFVGRGLRSAVAVHPAAHLTSDRALYRQLIDQVLGRVGRQHGTVATGGTAHVGGDHRLVDVHLVGGHRHTCGLRDGLIGENRLLGVALSGQLGIQVDLRCVSCFGCCLGLTRQLVELFDGVVVGVRGRGLRARKYPADQGRSGDHKHGAPERRGRQSIRVISKKTPDTH
ncbi:Uncharacterised protein [Mycobacteroides abscessus subsp. massiliense]|nr:Uncharacterised protein [Mycobacteroides abscessus subsp. massiliense]